MDKLSKRGEELNNEQAKLDKDIAGYREAFDKNWNERQALIEEAEQLEENKPSWRDSAKKKKRAQRSGKKKSTKTIGEFAPRKKK